MRFINLMATNDPPQELARGEVSHTGGSLLGRTSKSSVLGAAHSTPYPRFSFLRSPFHPPASNPIGVIPRRGRPRSYVHHPQWDIQVERVGREFIQPFHPPSRLSAPHLINPPSNPFRFCFARAMNLTICTSSAAARSSRAYWAPTAGGTTLEGGGVGNAVAKRCAASNPLIRLLSEWGRERREGEKERDYVGRRRA
jgi:hypothetical protein